ncbi:hypothetical protein CIB84_014658 [Bambusicola thoracicus]|uniref:Uncharacterized protein n=1 Tax=Bambusicola thoracicus TaxID=9083 RepID=A0A2P4SBU7_BAMTH|nr:hypothetical protein CIB84_014658 [Bambusicola thoracicus]
MDMKLEVCQRQRFPVGVEFRNAGRKSYRASFSTVSTSCT